MSKSDKDAGARGMARAAGAVVGMNIECDGLVPELDEDLPEIAASTAFISGERKITFPEWEKLPDFKCCRYSGNKIFIDRIRAGKSLVSGCSSRSLGHWRAKSVAVMWF